MNIAPKSKEKDANSTSPIIGKVTTLLPSKSSERKSLGKTTSLFFIFSTISV